MIWCGPLSRRFARRYARDGDTKSGAPAQPRFEGQPAAQLLGDQIEDDVKAEAGAALVAAGGEERVERAALNFFGHADAVVGYEDISTSSRTCRASHDDVPAAALGKRMHDALRNRLVSTWP